MAHILDHPARAGQGNLRQFRETGDAAALVAAVCDVIEGKRAVSPVQAALEAWTGDVVLGDAYPVDLLDTMLLEDAFDDPDAAEPAPAPPSRLAPFEPAHLAADLFAGLAEDEHPAVWIAHWLNVIFPPNGTARFWHRRLKALPEHAEDLIRTVVNRICAARGDPEVAELILVAADLLLPSKEAGCPRAPEAVRRLSNPWREELPQAINAWRWSDDAFAGFVPVLEALLAIPFQDETGTESESSDIWPELLMRVAAAVTDYSAERRQRVIDQWPADQPRLTHSFSDRYPNGEMDHVFVDATAEELAMAPVIIACARRFAEIVVVTHGGVCPVPRDVMMDLAADLRRLDACPKDVGWLLTLADQMVPDWPFNWLGDTEDWPLAMAPRHPARIRAEQLADIIGDIRLFGLDHLADAMTVWVLGTQILFWEGDLGLPPARLKALVSAVTTRETRMRPALARVEIACREAAARGAPYAAFYARVLETLIPPPVRPTLVMLHEPPR